MKAKITIVIIAFLCASVIVYSDPESPTSITIMAAAGNVTELLISTSQAVTDRWQGYYGNITGEVKLENANNWTMYSWEGISAPEGEIYAANQSVTNWDAIKCINLTSNYPGFNCTGVDEECLNITEIENTFGMLSTESDGINETFNNTLSSIMVGTKTLVNCPMTNLYVNNTPDMSQTWNETMLTINNTETIIFASVINHEQYGFNNRTIDFQMIVGVNGDKEGQTNYYFYVELS